MSATSYARITTRDHTGKVTTARYEVLADQPGLILARKVNAEGETTEDHYNAEGTLIDVQHAMLGDVIVKRVPLRMNLTYGTLETDPTGTGLPSSA